MKDLTLHSFAWLRGPLAAAGLALALGTLAAWRQRRSVQGPLCLAAMMVLLVHSAHRAMAVGGAVQRCVMDHDGTPVGRRLQVQLQSIGALLHRPGEGEQGVLRELPARAPVRDHRPRFRVQQYHLGSVRAMARHVPGWVGPAARVGSHPARHLFH